MTALACSLAFLGSLAFVAFVVWMRRAPTPDQYRQMLQGFITKNADRYLALEGRLDNLEHTTTNACELTELRETVSTLALAAGLKARGSPRV